VGVIKALPPSPGSGVARQRRRPAAARLWSSKFWPITRCARRWDLGLMAPCQGL